MSAFLKTVIFLTSANSFLLKAITLTITIFEVMTQISQFPNLRRNFLNLKVMFYETMLLCFLCNVYRKLLEKFMYVRTILYQRIQTLIKHVFLFNFIYFIQISLCAMITNIIHVIIFTATAQSIKKSFLLTTQCEIYN